MSYQKWVTTSAGVRIPGIIYGTAWKKERTADLVSRALQAGFRGIDTACQPKHYNEPLVGVALQRMKDQGVKRPTLYIQTKFTPMSSQAPDQVPYDKSSPVELQVVQSFETSKRNLQTHYVDGLLLHSPMPNHELTMKAWNAMENIQRTGGAHQLGISNCYHLDALKALYTDAKVKPAVLQNRFNKETGYDKDLRHWCSEHGVIYQSFWTLTANSHILTHDTVQTLAAKYKKTEAQIFFRYLSQIDIVPLTGTSSEQHMKDDLNIFEFELLPDELNAVTLLIS